MLPSGLSCTSHQVPAGGSWLCEHYFHVSASAGERRSAGTCAAGTPQNPLAHSSLTQARWHRSWQARQVWNDPPWCPHSAVHYALLHLMLGASSQDWAAHWKRRSWRILWILSWSLSENHSQNVQNGKWMPVRWVWCLWREESSWTGEPNTPKRDNTADDFHCPVLPWVGKAALSTGCPETNCPAIPLVDWRDKKVVIQCHHIISCSLKFYGK